MGLVFGEDWWESALKVIHKTSICARLTLIHFKVVFRCHNSKTRLAQIFPDMVDVWENLCQPSPRIVTSKYNFKLYEGQAGTNRGSEFGSEFGK